MASIPDAIGTFFEEKLLSSLPGLKDFRKAGNMPDFKWDRVWVEAKAAFHAPDYGIIPKQYQFAMQFAFSPLVYACGYHDFQGAMTKLKGGTLQQMVQQLHEEASIDRVFFVSSSVVQSMYQADARISKKAKREYCALSPRDFQRVVHNEEFRRAGRVVRAREHYNIRNCKYADATPLGFILTPSHYDKLAPMLEDITQENLFNEKAA